MVLVANYHAPEEKNLQDAVNTLKKFGVNNIRMQKDVFDADLYFRLLTLAKIGELERMTQYKATEEADRTAQLLTYPVLMAHDVVGFSEIIVGEDQKQHLEYARKLLRRHNHVHGSEYPIPVAKVVVGRVRDLRQSDKKMSKSFPEGCVFLDDSPEDMRRKFRKAVADEEGLENLRFLFREFVGEEIPERNQELKERLAEKLVEVFRV